MSAAETIQKAINKLEGLRLGSDEGDLHRVWRERRNFDTDRDVLDDLDQVIAEHVYYVDAELIVTLHRTIDAQLAILRLALEYGPLGTGQGSRFIIRAAALAEAIVGGAE